MGETILGFGPCSVPGRCGDRKHRCATCFKRTINHSSSPNAPHSISGESKCHERRRTPRGDTLNWRLWGKCNLEPLLRDSTDLQLPAKDRMRNPRRPIAGRFIYTRPRQHSVPYVPARSQRPDRASLCEVSPHGAMRRPSGLRLETIHLPDEIYSPLPRPSPIAIIRRAIRNLSPPVSKRSCEKMNTKIKRYLAKARSSKGSQ